MSRKISLPKVPCRNFAELRSHPPPANSPHCPPTPLPSLSSLPVHHLPPIGSSLMKGKAPAQRPPHPHSHISQLLFPSDLGQAMHTAAANGR